MTATDTPEGFTDYVGAEEALDDETRLGDLTSAPEQLAVNWLIWLRDVRGRSKNTLLQYNQVLRFWLEFCEEHEIDPLRTNLQEVEAFMTRKRKVVRRGSASSQNTDAAVLRLWYAWLVSRHVLQTNPAEDLRGPKITRGVGRPVEDEHWQIIWEHRLPPRLRAILGMGFYVGLRREEIWALDPEQITPTRIVRFKRKGGGDDTTDWLALAEVHARRLPHLLPDIDVFVSSVNYVRKNCDTMTPWRNPAHMYHRMSSLCKQLAIPQYTPHQLRHSTATNLLRAGVPPHLVMRMMNHSSFDITMRYVRAQGSDLKEWLNTLRD